MNSLETESRLPQLEPAIQGSMQLLGREVNFVVWHGFIKGGNQLVGALDIARYITSHLSERQGTSVGVFQEVNLSSLGFERPIAVAQFDQEGKLRVTGPREFPLEERELRRVLVDYIKQKDFLE